MKFQAKTDKEIAEEGLLPEGNYGFEISGAEDTVSKAGNDMIKLQVRVFNDDGQFIIMSDYLLEAIAYKLKHCCDACGLSEKYESGEIVAEDFIGSTGELKLKIRKDPNGQYPDQNNIIDYIVPNEGEEPLKPKGSNAAAESGDDLADEIPF